MPASRDDLVWYLAYGSNLHQERFARYVAGCRDTALPARWEARTVPGRMLFAGASLVWGGGVAVFDPSGDGEVAGRAYLLTEEQLDDVVTQEVSGGSGLYDEVVSLPDVDGVPVRTLGTRMSPVPAAPVPPYLRRVVHGLVETFGWSADTCADYLLAADGVAPTWTHTEVVGLHPGAKDLDGRT